jgi:hypothetical protein
MTLQASFMTCERSQNGLKMFLDPENMGVDISRGIYEFQIIGSGRTNLHKTGLFCIFMITFNTKNICIDASDQLVKFHDHIYNCQIYRKDG